MVVVVGVVVLGTAAAAVVASAVGFVTIVAVVVALVCIVVVAEVYENPRKYCRCASRIEPVVCNREKTHRGIQDGYQKDLE